jgi:hypothetical protein
VAVGVPEITPRLLNARPAGRLGEIDHALTVPPLFVGVRDDITTPTVRLKAFDE